MYLIRAEKWLVLSLGYLFFMLSCESVTASQPDSIKQVRWGKYTIQAGAYLNNTNSNIQLQQKGGGLGVGVDLERLAGLSATSFTGQLGFSFRFSKSNRHALSLSTAQFNRSSDIVLADEITIGDEVYPIGTEINSLFRLNITTLDYRYSLVQDNRVDLFISGGFYIMPIKFNLEAQGIIQEKSSYSEFVAPLPVLGIGTSVYLTEKLLIHQNLHFFYLKLNKYKGNMLDVNTSFEYRFSRWFGLGLGYNAFKINVEAQEQEFGLGVGFDGQLDYNHNGLFLYAAFIL